MPGWLDRRLDRELAPAAPTGRRPARDHWLKDWPLLLGLALSAVLIIGSTAVRGPQAKPAAPVKTGSTAGSDIRGEVVDVGDDGATKAKPAAPRKERATPARKSSARHEPVAGAPDRGATRSRAAGGGSPSSSSASSVGGEASHGGSGSPKRRASRGGGGRSGGGSGPGPAKPGKIVNVTGTSANYTNGPLAYAFAAPTHAPVVGKRWVLSISALRSGAPLRGRVKIDILHNGTIVGHVVSGQLRNGRFAHKFDWPERAVGHPLTVKTTILGGGFQQSFLFNVRVKSGS